MTSHYIEMDKTYWTYSMYVYIIYLVMLFSVHIRIGRKEKQDLARRASWQPLYV